MPKKTARADVAEVPPTAAYPYAPRTMEQLTSSATSAQGIGNGQREARGHGYALRGLNYIPTSRLTEGRFGRMFRLPPYIPTDQQIRAIADTMAENAGGPAPELDNPAIPAGYTYLGQFIDHDLTFDPVSSLDRQNDPDALTNFRTPRFDLDSVYGNGPADTPYLYDKTASGKLLIGRHDDEDDLPRNAQDTALIGDPRNDENIFVSQLHLTMLKFHNAVVDHVAQHPELIIGSETPFDAAQRIVRWHYQWIVAHDFLRRTVGAATLGAVLDESGPVPEVKLKFFEWTNAPFMPVEFSVAAYRFGHSQVRGRYKLNTGVPALPTFTSESTSINPLSHFGGFRILPPSWTIEWRRFFAVNGEGDGPLQASRRIDARIADPLRALPPEIAPGVPSLIVRNLTRGARLLLPSGQDVAAHMGELPLTDTELALPAPGPAPLWYYILKEAEVQANGVHLGQVGGRIVAEVILGLMKEDPSSYLRRQPHWKPFLPRAEGTAPGEDFTMPDLIAISGHGLGVTDFPGRDVGSGGAGRNGRG